MKEFKNEYRKFLVERLSFFRAQKRLSARELSERMGMSESYIAKFEMGQINMPSEVLLDALTVLEVSPQKFFSENVENYDENEKILQKINALSPTQREAIKNLLENMR